MESVLDKALKLARECEVYGVSQTDTSMSFEANRLKMVDTRETSGLALRLVRDGRIGFSSTTNLEEEDALVERALEMAPFGAEALLEMPSAVDYPSVDVHDHRLAELGMDDMRHLGQSVIDAVRVEWPQVQCEGRVGRSVTRTELMNSRGCRVSYTKATMSVYLEAVLIQGTDMLYVSESETSCHPIADVKPLADSMLLQLERASRIASVPNRAMPVIFTPRGLAGVLIGPLVSGFSGKTVLKGTSPLVGRLGEHIVDERISLWDDPTQPFIPGSRICDDEGIPSRATPLINKGKAASFLYDLQTAAQAGENSTGSASRSLATLPQPGPGVLLFSPGDTSFEDIVSGLEEALVVERLLGAGQGNILGGGFNANVLLGYYVSKGEIVGRAKDVMVSGNVYDALNRVISVGSESRWLRGFLSAPALLCEGVAVTAKG